MTVIASYHLKRPCGNIRPFCPQCVNRFAIDSCGPTKCQAGTPPSVICLEPKVPAGICTGCGFPAAIKVTDFNIAGSPISSLEPDEALLFQVEGSPCCWEVSFSSHTTGVLNSDRTCFMNLDVLYVEKFLITVCLNFDGDFYWWSASYTDAFRTYALTDLACNWHGTGNIVAGQIIGSSSTGGATVEADQVKMNAATFTNCTRKDYYVAKFHFGTYFNIEVVDLSDSTL